MNLNKRCLYKVLKSYRAILEENSTKIIYIKDNVENSFNEIIRACIWLNQACQVLLGLEDEVINTEKLDVVCSKILAQIKELEESNEKNEYKSYLESLKCSRLKLRLVKTISDLAFIDDKDTAREEDLEKTLKNYFK